MISRALGPEFGGSIGTLFFFANAIGTAFNGSGLVEALLSVFGESEGVLNGNGLPEGRWWKFLYASIINLITLLIALVGANVFSFAVTFIFIVMIIVYLTVVFSIMIRGPLNIDLPGMPDSNLTGQFTGLSFQTLQDNLYCMY